MVALDFFAEGRHLVEDAVMTTAYRNTVLEKVAAVPGYAAKQAEDRKFLAGKSSGQPISAVHGGPAPHLGPLCSRGRRETRSARPGPATGTGNRGLVQWQETPIREGGGGDGASDVGLSLG